jgi:hypothetical protein
MQHAYVDQELGTNIDHQITEYKGQCGAQCLQECEARRSLQWQYSCSLDWAKESYNLTPQQIVMLPYIGS